ncbi:MAG: hypothetical protein ACLU0O_02395 [Collinsella sp.]
MLEQLGAQGAIDGSDEQNAEAVAATSSPSPLHSRRSRPSATTRQRLRFWSWVGGRIPLTCQWACR